MTLMTLMRILMRMRTLLRKGLPRKQRRPRKRSHLTKTLQKRTRTRMRRKPNPLQPAKNVKTPPPLLPRPPISDPNLNPPAE
jgi:hypothetical protein